MSRIAAPITVTADDARRLNSIIENPETSEDVRKRCRTILLAGEGMQNKAIAKEVHVRENTVGDWRKAWISGGVSRILSIARTGRPKGKKRVEFEESLRNNENADFDPDDVAKRIGISKATMYRALRDADTQYDDQSMDDIRLLSAPRQLDIAGLFIAGDEFAIILRTTPSTSPNQHTADGHLFVHDSNVHALFPENCNDNSITINLLDALEILAQHTAGIDSDAEQNQTLNGFLCSLVPNIPLKDGDECYVIYSSTRQMKDLPGAHRHLHYILVQDMDRLDDEVHFWMDTLSSDTDYSDRFRNVLRDYINVRSSSAEAFRWCSCDIAMTEYVDNAEPDRSIFDDPSVKNVMVTTTRIYDRSGDIVDITHKEINVVPEPKDISFSDVTSASASLGMVDDGITGFFRTVGGETVQQYYATAIKKKRNCQGC